MIQSDLRERLSYGAKCEAVTLDWGEIPVTDKTTKIILAAIALGVWANVLRQPTDLQQHVDRNVSVIADNVSWIASGVCKNDKIC